MKSLTEHLWFEVPGRRGFVNITSTIEELVRKSGVKEGLCLVNAMHITASVYINDAEDGLLQDYEEWLEKLAPHEPTSKYRHNRTGEDNADAHLKRQIMGREVVVAITKGKLDFGPWEQIFYGEFDGGRRKRALVKIIESDCARFESLQRCRMSEYQYYEFQTVDHRLSEMEMHELRLHSTRACITATSFINEYHWGNFKGNADTWMEKHFDGHLYFANWGTRVLQLALPSTVLSQKTTNLYCTTDVASARRVSGKLILRFILEEDGGYDDLLEGDGLLSSLLPLRNDMAGGDLRCLYLGWLMSVQLYQVDEDELEPPLPSNLGKLSGVLSDFADFLRIDRDLIAVAAEASPRATSTKPNQKDMAAWLASLPADEKDRILVELMSGEDQLPGAKLLARFNRDRKAGDSIAAQPRRKVSELRAAAEERRTKKR